MNNDLIPSHPCQLWIGDENTLSYNAHTFFKNMWCLHNACNICVTCKQIDAHQYASFLWLTPPSNTYTIESIAPIFSIARLQQSSNSPYFFVIPRADFLSISCANALLKLLEEPPHGYYFLLLAQRNNAVIPTVVSRCIVRYYTSDTTMRIHQDIFNCFINKSDPTIFLNFLTSSKINESESVDLFDALVNHFTTHYKDALTHNNSSLVHYYKIIIDILQEEHNRLPMPGSSKLFWKNLYLRIFLS